MRACALAALIACAPGLDEGDTVPMPAPVERWDFETLSGWSQAGSCSDATWTITTGILEQQSVCHSKADPYDAYPGTLLQRSRSTFGPGWLVARVFVGDGGRFGLAISKQPFEFTRIVFDGARGDVAADTVLYSVFGGILTPPVIHARAEVEVPVAQWLDVAIERTETRLRVFLDHILVLDTEAPFEAPGSIGLYSQGGVDFRVDWLAYYAPGYVPWEPLP